MNAKCSYDIMKVSPTKMLLFVVNKGSRGLRCVGGCMGIFSGVPFIQLMETGVGSLLDGQISDNPSPLFQWAQEL